MAKPSSTSSSERRAAAAWLVALSLVVLLDRTVLGQNGLWPTLAERVGPRHRFESGVIRDRLELRSLRDAPAAQKRAVVVGSSRALAGFRLETIDRAALRSTTFGRIAHGGLNAFEMRAMQGPLLAAEPDAVVLVLSEFELNTPLRILSQSSFSSMGAIRHLAAFMGHSFVFEHRRHFYRLLSANLLNGYRYRQVLDRAGTGLWRRFPAGSRLATGDPPRGELLVISGGQRKRLGRQRREQLLSEALDLFPRTPRPVVETSVRRVRWIARGQHAELQRDLVRRFVGRLAEAGVRTVIVEAPMHPLAAELYDVTIREDFLEFTRSLERDFAVRSLRLEALGPFGPEDFTDLVHLGDAGGRRMTAEILAAVHETLSLKRQP